MAALTQTYKVNLIRITFTNRFDQFIEKILPRPWMLLSVGLVIAGLGIPLLMLAHMLPVAFFLGFVSFALVATGGVLALIFSGEI